MLVKLAGEYQSMILSTKQGFGLAFRSRQPKPDIMDMQGKYSRGSIAWHMGDYENINERNSRRSVLVRQSTTALPRASRSPKLPKVPRKEEERVSLLHPRILPTP
ncbi:uncharacterized protein C4orf45 homolog [Meles meles]|uniref:uncharacterized protein C4orf45 homolog n=1 Tax=Meles meles TaxID=9662 RepID=UPI001E6989AC|nr:uncharacterized protein C4orf45 homolog [Meles meles]